MVKSLGGSPTMQKPSAKKSALLASVFMPLAAARSKTLIRAQNSWLHARRFAWKTQSALALVPAAEERVERGAGSPSNKACTMDGLSALGVRGSGARRLTRARRRRLRRTKLEAPRASVTPPLSTAPVPHAVPPPRPSPPGSGGPEHGTARLRRGTARSRRRTTGADHRGTDGRRGTARTAVAHRRRSPRHCQSPPRPPAASDEAARKLAADHAAIREAYAREQAAAAPPAPPAAPLVQGVDDEWADWRGCICGGSYYGEMVGCDGHCDNWFHFACVGLTRLTKRRVALPGLQE